MEQYSKTQTAVYIISFVIGYLIYNINMEIPDYQNLIVLDYMSLFFIQTETFFVTLTTVFLLLYNRDKLSPLFLLVSAVLGLVFSFLILLFPVSINIIIISRVLKSFSAAVLIVWFVLYSQDSKTKLSQALLYTAAGVIIAPLISEHQNETLYDLSALVVTLILPIISMIFILTAKMKNPPVSQPIKKKLYLLQTIYFSIAFFSVSLVFLSLNSSSYTELRYLGFLGLVIFGVLFFFQGLKNQDKLLMTKKIHIKYSLLIAINVIIVSLILKFWLGVIPMYSLHAVHQKPALFTMIYFVFYITMIFSVCACYVIDFIPQYLKYLLGYLLIICSCLFFLVTPGTIYSWHGYVMSILLGIGVALIVSTCVRVMVKIYQNSVNVLLFFIYYICFAIIVVFLPIMFFFIQDESMLIKEFITRHQILIPSAINDSYTLSYIMLSGKESIIESIKNFSGENFEILVAGLRESYIQSMAFIAKLYIIISIIGIASTFYIYNRFKEITNDD